MRSGNKQHGCPERCSMHRVQVHNTLYEVFRDVSVSTMSLVGRMGHRTTIHPSNTYKWHRDQDKVHDKTNSIRHSCHSSPSHPPQGLHSLCTDTRNSISCLVPHSSRCRLPLVSLPPPSSSWLPPFAQETAPPCLPRR